MRHLLLLLLVAATACPPSQPAPENQAGPQPTPPPAGPLPTFPFTPRAEDDRAGPVGTGLQRCELYIYAWVNDQHCRVQVNHCSLEREGGEQVVCATLADERTLECGGHAEACGQDIQCVCPQGAAEPVVEAPGTVHVRPEEMGRSLQSEDALCQARVSTLPGGAQGPPPAPCIFALHQCASAGGQGCVDMTQMLSCGARSTVCGRPVRCDCPD